MTTKYESKYEPAEDGGYHVILDGARVGYVPAGHPLIDAIKPSDIVNPVPEPEPSKARQDILKLESQNAPTQREVREFILAVAQRIPQVADLPLVTRLSAVESQITPLRSKAR